MNKEQIIGNLAAGTAYTIFGLNIVFCKDISNSAVPHHRISTKI